MTQFDKTIEVDLGRVFGSCVCVGMCGCVVVGVCAGNPVARPSAARKGKHTAGNVQSPVSGVRLLAISLNYTCWRQTFLHRCFCQIPKDKKHCCHSARIQTQAIPVYVRRSEQQLPR